MSPCRLLLVAFLAVASATPPVASAHCDTLNGPVVTAAKLALERSDVTPVLMWVQPQHEAEIREAFERALTVRQQSVAARELADTYFFEVVVRLHRQGEGAPYTGLKPAEAPVDPLVRAADHALDRHQAELLVKQVLRQVENGLRERLARAEQARADSAKSVEAGRQYVAAYVDLMHYLERLSAISGDAAAEEHAHAH